ncbi:DUF927 domain-containing protein [Mesorhizobium sp. LNJC394B00]|uniref:DUF927 domain-containing protein n=1 Tax=unclassified Mesorhizobium TaxID=325217 RepID=UPI000A0258D8|nr:DUF927 domain-containing protein [Mesorhizobium sp. LNJC394B00]
MSTTRTTTGLVSSDDGPQIIDAVIDQHGNYWIKFGTATNSCWVSLAELATDEKAFFAKLTNGGVRLYTSKSRNKFKGAVEEHKEYRKGLVAATSGWVGRHFVFGDGTVISPKNDARELIVTFPPDRKFTPVGSLIAWQDAMSPVKKQPVCLFVLIYALVAPLLKFAPPNFLNPQLELVGPPECGKTTIAVAAASVWAGNPDSEVGGGQTWDVTALYLDRAKAAHAGGILVLDEGNLAGADKAGQKEVIRRGIFSMSSKGMRRRFIDVTETPLVHVAVLSTSNTPLRDLVEVPGNTRDALMSRMPTIQVDDRHEYGVFKFLPKGFATSREAADAIRNAALADYGVASRAFVEHLMNASEDEAGLRIRIQDLIGKFRKEVGEVEGVGLNRVLNTVALTFAAGVLAKEWGVVPKGWGRLLPAFAEILQSIRGAKQAKAKPRAIDRVVDYVSQNDLANAKNLRKRPLTAEQFHQARGIMKADDSEVLIPTSVFTSTFSDHTAMLNELKKEGYLKGEGGMKPKMSIKTPKMVCAVGRVYRIVLPAQTL